jgi:predicted Zn-dependent protease
MKTFSAHYFDGKVARAIPVTVALDRLEWIVTGQNVNLTVRASEVEVSSALGQGARFMALPGSARCEAVDPLEMEEALRAAGPLVPAGRLRWLERHPSLTAGLTLGLIVAAIFGYFWTMPKLVERIASSLPPSVERRLSDGALRSLDGTYFTASELDWQRQAKLRTDFKTLVNAIGFKGEAKLVFRRMGDNSPNAFALPNGTVVLLDALVDLAENDDEILAVLAHEIGHLHHRHALRSLFEDSITLVLVTSITGDASVLGNLAAALPLTLLSSKHQRAAEKEADEFAFAALKRAGISAIHFANIMERLESVSPDEGSYFSSHPPTAERIERFRNPPADSKTGRSTTPAEGSKSDR